jgi:hypothetical protein
VISRKRKCIFVHIPKCAGNSIQKVIWPGKWREEDLWGGFVDAYHNKYQTGGLQHLCAWQIRDEVGRRRFDSYFKFTIVRNPFDRLVSQFAYMRRRPDLREFVAMDEDASFAEYVELIQRKRHVQWESQTSFVYDDDGAMLVDFLGRFETLDPDMGQVFAHLGMDGQTVPRGNASARGPYRDYYTPEIRAQVEDMYGADLERFGYEF